MSYTLYELVISPSPSTPLASQNLVYYPSLFVKMFLIVNLDALSLHKCTQILDELEAGQSIIVNFRLGPGFVQIYDP